jgi:hypothetical protein
MVGPVRQECRLITLLARLNEQNEALFDFHLFPIIDRPHPFRLKLDDHWLKRSVRLYDLADFLKVVKKVASRRAHKRRRPS